MKNLKNKIIIMGLPLIAFPIFMGIGNILTYNAVKKEILKIEEKKGIKSAQDYCFFVLKKNYEDSRFSQFINGGDNAAREYLKLQNY